MLDHVKDYYGKTLQHSDDLQTDACCTLEAPPEHIKPILSKIHEEVSSKYYGCGLVVPTDLKGLRVLDLGSGSGRDAYMLSALVGETGSVVGVDMTDEQLDVARRHIDYHRQAFGHEKSNASFHKGYIEKLDQLPFEDGSFDLIISNCVINLSPDKDAVLKQAYRLLAEGGEMYFSDVYSDRRVPEHLVDNELLYGECLSGALYWNDFMTIAKRQGFGDPRLVEDRPLTIENDAIKTLLDPIRFFSATYRLFKISSLEPACEDYGEAVVYRGSIAESQKAMVLDNGHVFPAGKVIPVCGNSYDMLKKSRFSSHFDFFGTRQTHFGIFEGCGANMPFDAESLLSRDPSPCC